MHPRSTGETTSSLPHLRRRILDYAERRAKKLLPGLPALHPGAGRLLVEIYQAGQLGKSEVPALLGLSERTAREVMKALLQEGLIAAVNQKAPLTLGFPSHVLDDYFPALCYKAGTVSVPYTLLPPSSLDARGQT